jgi:uncharacterized membrane protein
MKKRSTPAPASTTPQQGADSSKHNEELLLLKKIISEAKVFRRPSPTTKARSGCKGAAKVRNADQQERGGAV